MQAATQIVPEPAQIAFQRRGRLGFAFGRRAYSIFAIGLGFVGAAFLNPQFLWAVLAWDVAVMLLWGLDLLLLPRPGAIQLRTKWSGTLMLGVPARLWVTLEARSRQSLAVDVTCDLAPQLSRLPLEASATCAMRRESSSQFSFTPSKRGDAQLGAVYIRYRSPLGIAERWAFAPLSQTVRVYPSTGDRTEQSLNLLRTRRIEVQKKLARRRGVGREFESLRDYQIGDSVRDICWTATARRGKPIVKEFQIERSQPIWVVIDCGRLMRMKVGDRTKLDFAVSAALNLCEVAMFGGDRVGVLAYGYKSRRILGLGRGNQHLRMVMDQLSLVQAEPAEADHIGATANLLARQSRRSLIVWITDLPDTAITPEVIEGASALTRNHVVLFAAIADPVLKAEAERKISSADEVFEAAAAVEVLHRRERVLASLRERGARTIEVSSEDLARSVVNEYLSLKERDAL